MATIIAGSKEPTFASQEKPSKAGFGQNGFRGSSSDVPGENTTSGFEASKPGPVLEQIKSGNGRGLRNVNEVEVTNAAGLPVTFGQVDPNRNNQKI
jgi:hypothetical protein